MVYIEISSNVKARNLYNISFQAEKVLHKYYTLVWQVLIFNHQDKVYYVLIIK